MQEEINVINLPKRTERLSNFKQQAVEQGFQYRVWEGIIDLAAVFRGINLAHKRVIMYAKARGLKRCHVAEDDICFIGGKKAWEYYLSKIPNDYDLNLGMVYEGKIGEDNRLLPNPYTFSGLTLYTCHERFYEKFLSVKDMDHLDKTLGALAGEYKFYVTDRFVCKQMDGYSDQKKKECKYDHLLKGRKLFGVNP